MAPLDIGQWLDDVTADAPAGPNLEFDADFGALERAAQGKPEQQFGDTVIPAEDPDWKDVDIQAAALLARTRDLRVAAHLAVARLRLSGVPAYAEILTLIRSLLQTRWEQVHPQLDPEDDNDPTLRANALLRLADPIRVMRQLRDMPLAASARAGKVSWRDIAIATGALDPEPGRDKMTEGVIRGLFADTDPARLQSLREAIGTAVQDIAAIPAAFDEHAGYGTGPDFTDLHKLLREIQRDIDRYAVAVALAAGPEPAPPTESDMPSDAELAPATPVRPQGGVSAAMLTTVSTRADALRLLDLVCQYYERHEPSSPLPLLIERARRLADKSFLDILRDLAPDGLSQAQNIVGSANE